jgi:SpoVK/Ycf46/Vps4 family AAA+-type ATPase
VDDIELAKRSVKPQSVQQVSPQIPDVTWDDIGGLEDIKVTHLFSDSAHVY